MYTRGEIEVRARARTCARTQSRARTRTHAHAQLHARTHTVARTHARTVARTQARTPARPLARTHARCRTHARRHARTHAHTNCRQFPESAYRDMRIVVFFTIICILYYIYHYIVAYCSVLSCFKYTNALHTICPRRRGGDSDCVSCHVYL